LLCGGIFIFNNRTLSFLILLDGKPLPIGTALTVQVDGKPFTSGLTITPGPHKLTAELQNAEFFERRVWIFYGDKDLGALPLESIKGSLLVSVNPSPASVIVRQGAEVVGKGDAPLAVEKLPLGDYELEIKRGEYKEIHPVKIQSKPRTEAKIDLNLGSVSLSSDPADAEFDLSGNRRHWQGKLPMRIDDVPIGNYSLLTRRKGWELSGDILVSRGGIMTNTTEFPYGSIEVTSEPSGLTISTNGVEIGRTPLTLHEVRPGQYTITVSDGANELVADVSVGPKEAAKHAFIFRYGTVQLASTPSGASVIRKGMEAGKTPLKLERIPAGEITIGLKLDGYVTTNISLHVLEGETANMTAKLVSERYLEAMQQAREALKNAQYSESQKFITNALEIEPNDSAALKLRNEVIQAAAQAAEALRTEVANAKAQEIVSLKWLDFQKVIFDCTDTKQVQYSVQIADGYYQDYIDNNGKRKQRFIQTGQHTEIQTRIESTFSPTKFSQKYEGKTFGFNCPGEWSVSKIDKQGGIILKAGGFILPDKIEVTASASNRDTFISLQKGQKVKIKGVLRKYEHGILSSRTLYLEDAEILDK